MKPRRLAVTILALILAQPCWADKKLDDAMAKAEEQLRKGRPEDAVKTLNKVAQSSSDPAAHQALARLHVRLGHLDAALESYRKAAQVAAAGPARSAALAQLALFEMRVAPAAQARADAEQAVAAHESASAWGAVAWIQARSGQVEAALVNSERGVTLDARSALAQAGRGEALLAAGRAAEAAASFRKAQELDPGAVFAPAGLARALAALGQGSAALEAARHAVELDDKSAEALAALALAHLAQDPGDQKSEAIAQAQQATFLEPRNAQVKLVVARVFEARGQFDQASVAYHEAAALDPGLALARLAPVELRYKRHEWDAALAELAQLPAEEREGLEALLLEGRVRLAKEDFPGAARAFEKAARLRPDSAEVQSLLGNAWYLAKQTEKALAGFKRATELEPANVTYASNYALLLGYSGRTEQAVSVLKKLTSAPGYADAAGFINLGWQYRSMRPPRVPEGVAAYEKALRLEPKNGQAAYGIALTYYAGRQWDLAARAFERAAAVDKRLAGDATNAIGWCRFFQREMPAARAKAEEAQRAGVPDAADLLAAIKRYEEAVKEGEARAREAMAVAMQRQREAATATDLGGLLNQLREGNPAQQKQAVGKLCRAGREAVPHLAYALLSADIGAREEIVDCLTRMTPPPCAALKTLERLVAEGPPVPNPNCKPKECELEVREARLVSDMARAGASLRATCK